MAQVLDIFHRTQASFPGAEVFTSTLDDFTIALQAALPSLHLPVVTEEIGDTWIYGIGSRNLKNAMLLSYMLRVRSWCQCLRTHRRSADFGVHMTKRRLGL